MAEKFGSKDTAEQVEEDVDDEELARAAPEPKTKSWVGAWR